jgi:hypothetical protein
MKAESEHEKGIPLDHQRIDPDGRIIIELILQDRRSSLQRLTLLELSFRISMFLLSIFQLSIIQPPTRLFDLHAKAVFLIPLMISLIVCTTYISNSRSHAGRIRNIDTQIFRLLEKGAWIEDAFIRTQESKYRGFITQLLFSNRSSESLGWLFVISSITLIRILQ